MIPVTVLFLVLEVYAHIQKDKIPFDEMPIDPEVYNSDPVFKRSSRNMKPKYEIVSTAPHEELKDNPVHPPYPVSATSDSNTKFRGLNDNSPWLTLAAHDESVYAFYLIQECASRLRCGECIVGDECFYCKSIEKCFPRFFLNEGICPFGDIYYLGTCRIKFFALSWGFIALFVLIIMVILCCVYAAIRHRRKYRFTRLHDNYDEECPKYRLSVAEKAYYRS